MKNISMKVRKSALEFILDCIRRSEFADPVVSFVGQTDPTSPHPELVRAHLRNESDDVLRALILKYERPELLRHRWRPIVLSRRDLPDNCLVEAGGVVFCFPPEQIELMAGWVLDIEEGNLVVKDADGLEIPPPRPQLFG